MGCNSFPFITMVCLHPEGYGSLPEQVVARTPPAKSSKRAVLLGVASTVLLCVVVVFCVTVEDQQEPFDGLEEVKMSMLAAKSNAKVSKKIANEVAAAKKEVEGYPIPKAQKKSAKVAKKTLKEVKTAKAEVKGYPIPKAQKKSAKVAKKTLQEVKKAMK